MGHGSLDLNANGSFSYTPDEDYEGIDSFTYKVVDSSTESETKTVYIGVGIGLVTVERDSDAEEGSSGQFKFTRTGNVTLSQTATFSIDGKALAGTDFTITGNGVSFNANTGIGNVTFAAHATTANVTVSAQTDTLPEGFESVVATVEEGDDWYVPGAYSAVVLIEDYQTPDAEMTFVLPDDAKGSITYTVPYDYVDPDLSWQSLSLSNFMLYLDGETITTSNASFTTSPTAQFVHGELVGITFDVDTSSIGGFAYSAVSMSGFTVTADDGVNPPINVAADKKAEMVVDFGDATTGQVYSIEINVAFRQGGMNVKTFPPITLMVDAMTTAAQIRTNVKAALDEKN